MPPSIPPKRPTPTAGNPPVPAPVQPVPSINLGSPHTTRIQRAIGTVDSDPQTPTTARSVISSLFRFANPNLTLEHLPRTLRVHPLSAERGMKGGSRWDLFIFHASNAIAALQDAYRKDRVLASIPASKTDDKIRAKQVFDDSLILLEGRTKLLERLAEATSSQWVVRGTDATGYHLITQQEQAAIWRKEAEVVDQVSKAQSEIEAPEHQDVEE